MDDTKGSIEAEYKGLPQTMPFLHEMPPLTACKMLIDDQPPCVLRPHEHNDRSCTAPHHGSPDIWMDDTKGSFEAEYKGLPQTMPFLYEIPPLTACKMLIDDQPPFMLRPHEHNDRSCTAPHHGSPGIYRDDTKGSIKAEYKGLPQTMPFLPWSLYFQEQTFLFKLTILRK
jgi:hypothetical protein